MTTAVQVLSTNDDLALPGTVTDVSLHLPDGLPYDQWVRTLTTLGAMNRGAQWWLGDCLRFGYGAYDHGKYDEALKVTGYSYNTLKNFGWVASRYERSLRSDLSWSHHRAAAGLETPERRAEWLDKAISSGWSKDELRKQIGAAKRVAGATRKPSENGSKKPPKSQTPDKDFKGRPSRVDPNKVLAKMVYGLEEYAETVGRLSEDRLKDISELAQRGREAATTIRTFFKGHCK